jgi:putative membrane protein
MLEPILAYLHIAAILALFVFLTSQAALCRTEWMSPAVVRRLARVDILYLAAAIAVLATGVLRVVLGAKGMPTYLGNWLLHLKFTGFIVIGLLSIGPTLAYRRWLKAANANGSLPSAAELSKTRKLVMIEAHLGALVPLAATFMARGWGV